MAVPSPLGTRQTVAAMLALTAVTGGCDHGQMVTVMSDLTWPRIVAASARAFPHS
jgi:hypothetical protein